MIALTPYPAFAVASQERYIAIAAARQPRKCIRRAALVQGFNALTPPLVADEDFAQSCALDSRIQDIGTRIDKDDLEICLVAPVTCEKLGNCAT